MAIEQQVNVQELQRLNDAIVATMEAIRRVVPQLAVLQHAQQSQFVPSFGGVGTTSPYGQIASPMAGLNTGSLGTLFASPTSTWGQVGYDPITALYTQAHAQALRQLIGQGVGGFGYTNPMSFGAPVAQPSFNPWAIPSQAPTFSNLAQRPF